MPPPFRSDKERMKERINVLETHMMAVETFAMIAVFEAERANPGCIAKHIATVAHTPPPNPLAFATGADFERAFKQFRESMAYQDQRLRAVLAEAQRQTAAGRPSGDESAPGN